MAWGFNSLRCYIAVSKCNNFLGKVKPFEYRYWKIGCRPGRLAGEVTVVKGEIAFGGSWLAMVLEKMPWGVSCAGGIRGKRVSISVGTFLHLSKILPNGQIKSELLQFILVILRYQFLALQSAHL